MKALVTGATGFIGSHLAEALLEKGIHVRCLVRDKNHLKWLTRLPVELAEGDCLHKESLEEAVQDINQVFHVAGLTKAVEEKNLFDTNAQGTDNLIHACLENKTRVEKFILLSSQAAAGPCRNGHKKCETDSCDPVSPYGRSKRAAEKLALAHSEDINLLILRPSAVYGPRDRDIFLFFKWVSKRIKPCLMGEVQQISLCYVRDLVEAILCGAQTETQSGETFFLSDGREYNMDDIGDACSEAMHICAYRFPVPRTMMSAVAFFSEYYSKISGKPSVMSRGKVEEMCQKNWLCGIDKARSLLGFEPKIQLSEGAKLTFDWYRNENWL